MSDRPADRSKGIDPPRVSISRPYRPSRRGVLVGMSTLLALGTGMAGCSSLTGKKSDGDESAMAKLLESPEPPELVREAAVPRGMEPIRITGVGLVNSLHGTGGAADPSPYRDQLIEEMRRNDVSGGDELLERADNALVTVTATVPAGAKRGDTIDLTVNSPNGNNANSLHGGWLLDTRMRLQQLIQGRIRKGDVLAMGTGPVVTRASFQGDADEGKEVQAVILGGGTVQKTRNMGLVIRPEFQHVKVASEIAGAINRRFFFFDGTTRRGVAKAVEDDYVELELHPRYEGSLGRYVAVVRAIAIDAQKANQQSRLTKLAEMLKEPGKASDAAIQLEALGESAIPTLVQGLESENPELRFYAAESLAYLDRKESIEPLEDAVSKESAFRYPALTAMEGLAHPGVVDSLLRLFDESSIETRYGAFVAMRNREDAGFLLSPQPVGDAFRLYEIESAADPAVVLSAKKVPEIVIFGKGSPLRFTGALLGPNALIVKADAADPDKLRISRFEVGQEDRRTVVPATVRGLVEGIIGIGGDYGDVVSVLRTAKSKRYLEDQLAIDPLPKALRTYYREEESE